MSILKMSIQAGVFIVAIVFIRTIALNKLPKTTFLVLWAVALVRLLVPFSISSQFSIYTLVGKAFDRASAHTMPTPGTMPLQNNPLISEVGAVITPAQVMGQQAVPIDPLLLAWIIGMAAAFIFFAVVFRRNCREVSFAWIVRGNAFIDEWLGSHKLLRPISVLQSDRITTPITVGYLRPRIILPKAMDMKYEQLLRHVLTHEYYHIRRFDAVWKFLITVALCIHWFNPLIWIMAILINRDLEITCDEMVVRYFGADKKEAYAYSLIGMAEQRSKFSPLFSGFGKNAAEERVTAIMKYKKSSVVAILMAAFLVVGMTLVFAANTGAPPAKTYAVRFRAGETVAVQVVADSVSDMNSYEFELHYDDSAVKIQSIHSAIDGIKIFGAPMDNGYMVVNGIKSEDIDSINGDNMPICVIVMAVMKDGPVDGLSLQRHYVANSEHINSPTKSVEVTSGWDFKIVANLEDKSLILKETETNLYELSDELPEMVYSEESISVEPGHIDGDYSGQLRLDLEKQEISPGESSRVDVALNEPTELILNEPDETPKSSAAKLTCWFDPDELTYHGFDEDGNLLILSETVDSASGIVTITFMTPEESHYRLDNFGTFRFMVPKDSQLSERQSSMSIVAEYVIKDGDKRLLLAQSGEISISIR